MAPNKLPTHYAAIVLSGKVLSLGVSGLAGCSTICKNAITRHAEMDAIHKIRKSNRIKKADMWSVRWKKTPEGDYILANAKPCLYCQQVALRHGIKSVYYSTDTGQIKKEHLVNLNTKLTAGSVLHLKNVKNYENLDYKTKHNNN